MAKQMKCTKYNTPIATFVCDDGCVVPGYTTDGEFGYFVCKQRRVEDAIEYYDISHFVRKEDETSYQLAVDLLGFG